IIIESFAQVEEELKDSYDSLDPMWQSDNERFLKLMLIDGCFTLEIFRPAIETPGDYHSDDLIFGNHGKLYIWPFIRQDMLLLENQLPMLVLDKLLAISKLVSKEWENACTYLIYTGKTWAPVERRRHKLQPFARRLQDGSFGEPVV
ncbi:unnamed protein product, partial [Ilex paraguariensis]